MTLTAREVLLDAIATMTQSFDEANTKLGNGATVDPIHDARVALRRLRSLLRSYAPLFERTFAASLRADLGWYASLLSDLRDLDVTAEALAADLTTSSDSQGRAALERYISAERHRALAALEEGRASRRYEETLGALGLLASAPPMTLRANNDAPTEFYRLLRRPWRDVRQAARRARATGEQTDLHNVRIRSKELRYAGEIAAGALGPRCLALARQAARVQDRIGTHLDARRTVEFLEEFERFAGTYPALTGPIVDRLRRDARRGVKSYRRDLRKLKKRWRALREEAHAHRRAVPAQPPSPGG